MFSEAHVPANWIGPVFDCRLKSCDTRRLKKIIKQKRKKVKRSGCCCGNALGCFHHTSHKHSAKQLILPKPSQGVPTTLRGRGIVVFAATVHQAEIPMLWFRRDLVWLFFIDRCVHTVVALSFCFSHRASILASTFPQQSCLRGLVFFLLPEGCPQGQQRHARHSPQLCICRRLSIPLVRWSGLNQFFVPNAVPLRSPLEQQHCFVCMKFFFVLWENVGVFWPIWTEFSSEFSTGRISWTFCRSNVISCFCFSFTAMLLTSSFFFIQPD